jgi:alpha-tubulin suppressor-like RCC1 family protein
MPNQFFSPAGDIEDYFVSEYWIIDQRIGDQLFAWGNCIGGHLGTREPGFVFIATPSTTFSGGTNWKQVSGGGQCSAGVKSDGTLWMWGVNNVGQLGIGVDFTTKTIPVTTFVGGNDWNHVSCNSGPTYNTLLASIPVFSFTTAIKNDGTLWIWGNSSAVPFPRNINLSLTPVLVSSGSSDWSDTPTTNSEDLYTIDVGSNSSTTDINSHAQGIKNDGTLWSWGRLGAYERTPFPEYSGTGSWKQITSGDNHALGIKTDGTLWGWHRDGFSVEELSVWRFNSLIPITPSVNSSGWADTPTTNPEDLYTIAAGTFTAAIKTDGTLWTWGSSAVAGASGSGSLRNSITPITTFVGGNNWKQVSAGSDTAAAIKTDGTLWIWGSGTAGKLGNAGTTGRVTPITTFAGGNNWRQVSTGHFHTAAIKTDGTLWTWGDGGFGELGIGLSSVSRSTPVTTFAGGNNWRQVSCGTNNISPHTAAVKTDGTLWTWGYNTGGKLGQLLAGFGVNVPRTTFVGGNNWRQVSCGFNQTAAIKTDGTLWMWGNSALGMGGLTQISTPGTTFVGGNDWKQVSTGTAVTAAIKTDGTLWVWGANFRGQLGTGDLIDRSTPSTTFIGGTDWKQVSCVNNGELNFDDEFIVGLKGNTIYASGVRGQIANINHYNNVRYPINIGFWNNLGWSNVSTCNDHTAAISNDGTLWIWGNNASRQLGLGSLVTLASVSTPSTTFAGGNNWRQVSCGNRHTAAIKTDGTLWAWGNNLSGRIGAGSLTGNVSSPVTTFYGGTDWKQVSCGYDHTASIKTDGTLWTWGDNSTGGLGLGDTSQRGIPTNIAGNWKQAYAGNKSTSAIKTDGTLWMWGNNTDAQLGINNQIDKLTPVTTFLGGSDWLQVAQSKTGRGVTIGLKGDGINNEVYSWGNNVTSVLGTLEVSSPITPGKIDLDNFKQVSSGGLYVAGIRYDGTLWLWGNNLSGELATADYLIRSTPVTTFAGGNDWKQVSCGYKHAAAVKTDGTLWLWGEATQGALGNGVRFGFRSTPVTTRLGGNDWRQVSCGRGGTSAIKNDGTLWTWGNNNNGNLSTLTVSTPVTTFAGGNDWKLVSRTKYEPGFVGAIKTNGTLWMWGNNADRKLGLNTNVFSVISTPVTTFAGGNDWRQVSCGDKHTLAVKTGVSAELPFI